MKYVIGFGALAVLALVVVFISKQFSSVFDGGVVVNRGGGQSFDDEAQGGGDGGKSDSPAPTVIVESDGTGNGGGSDSGQSGSNVPKLPTRGTGRTNPATVGNTTPGTDESPDDNSIGRDGEQEFFPEWVAEFPTPEQPQDAGGTSKPTAISVGRSADKVSKFTTIKAAIEQLPASGGVIELVGQGPFDFGPLQIDGNRKIVIAGDPENPPVVTLMPDYDQPEQPVVSVTSGSLTLLNLQMAALPRRFLEDGPVTLFEVQASDLAVRNCTCSLLGKRGGSTVAFRSAASTRPDRVSESSRILLDRVFVHGDRLTTVAFDGAACELVASGGLFVSGEAPIVQVSGSRPPTAKPNTIRRRGEEIELPSRVLRFLSCTGVAVNTAFQFEPGSDVETMPVSAVLTLNSLFSSTGGQGEHYFVTLGKWPEQPNRGAGESSFAKLRWVVRSTISVGWTAFLHHEADPPLLLTSVAQWQNSWNEIVHSSRFIRGRPWPTAQLKNLATVTPQQFDPETSGVNGVFATDKGLPGCPTAGFVTPPPELLERAVALADRPIMPADIFQTTEPYRVVQVDLNKGEDLGRVISREDWRSGTLFVASGSGARKSGPIQVRGKSLRIEFRQTEGLPLEVTPRAVNPRTVAEEGLLADAFFSIDDGGRLEVANGRFRIPNSTSTPYPKWLVVAREGSFLFDGCLVEGPVVDKTRTEGLIRWERPDDLPLKPKRAGQYEQTGEIRNSFFKSTGTILKIDGLGRAMVVRNSLLVTPDELLDLNVRGTGPIIHSAVEVDQSTLSAGEVIFGVSASPRRTNATLPLQFYATGSVFAPPLSDADKGGPVLLSYNEPAARSESQVHWWGTANGFSDQLKKYLDGPAQDAGSAEKFEDGWAKAWAPAACIRPLAGSGAVVLQQPVTTLQRVEPNGFALHPSSKAVAWSSLGKPIGANVADLQQAGPQRRFGAAKPDPGERTTPTKPRF